MCDAANVRSAAATTNPPVSPRQRHATRDVRRAWTVSVSAPVATLCDRHDAPDTAQSHHCGQAPYSPSTPLDPDVLPQLAATPQQPPPARSPPAPETSDAAVHGTAGGDAPRPWIRQTPESTRPSDPDCAQSTGSSPQTATPREISSRSRNVRCRCARHRRRGRTPPVDSTNARIDPPVRPSCRPIDRVVSPDCHRSHTSTRSNSENPTTTTSSDKRHTLAKVLHSPPETTGNMGGSSPEPW